MTDGTGLHIPNELQHYVLVEALCDRITVIIPGDKSV